MEPVLPAGKHSIMVTLRPGNSGAKLRFGIVRAGWGGDKVSVSRANRAAGQADRTLFGLTLEVRMKLVKSLLLGSAAALAAAAGAQAADLPMRKAAPVEYVRVCTAYGAGFFYIPGTDTCIRVGGRARFEYQYTQQRAGRNSNSGYRGLGRLQIDARTQTPYGTLRAFVRFEIASRTGGYLKSGTGERYAQSFSATGVDTVAQAQKFVEVDKAFIQFAGFTAGKAASFFDFYAHDLELIGSSVGSDQASTNLFAYTATFGSGFSATISAEDPTFRRNPVFFNAGPTVAAGGLTPAAMGGINFASGGQAFAFVGNAFNAAGIPTSAVAFNPAQLNNVPDGVGVLRYDQAWGSAQISAASHEIRVSSFNSGPFAVNGGAAVPLVGAGAGAGFIPRLPGAEYGYAVQGGLKINVPQLAPGDVLWLQAGYAMGASHYTGVYGNQGQESLTANDTGRAAFPGYDMFVDNRGRAHLTESYSGTIAFLHYYTPEIRQGIFGSYGRTHYDREMRNGATSPISGVFSGAAATALTAAGGIFNSQGKDFSHIYVGSNLIWSPVRDLDIGVEAIYDRLEFLGGASGGRVVDLNKNIANAQGLPRTIKFDDTILARFRIQRDF